jgi:transcriptional regulator with XRE-family HTH domain
MRQRKDTLAELSAILHVDINTVWRWKAGQRMPSLEIQRKICERYGCTLDELLNGPQKRKLEIIIDLEGVEEMDMETIKSNSAFCGYRGSDDSLVFRGAVLVGGASNEDVIEETVNAIRAQLEAAFACRARLKNA